MTENTTSTARFMRCEVCSKVIPVLSAFLVELENGTVRCCLRCQQRLEKQDTREYLEETR